MVSCTSLFKYMTLVTSVIMSLETSVTGVLVEGWSLPDERKFAQKR